MACFVKFVDGPMRGQRRYLPDDRPPIWFLVAVSWPFTGSESTVPYETVEYERKPNRFDGETEWVYALKGSRVGDPLFTVVGYSVDLVGSSYMDVVRSRGREQLDSECAKLGLRAVNVRKAWDGPLSAYPEHDDYLFDADINHGRRAARNYLQPLPHAKDGYIRALCLIATAGLPV